MSNLKEQLKLYERPTFINGLLLGITIVLFLLKLTLGFMVNSLALQADAIDNITDVIFIVTGLIGIFFAQKKPNEKFPYGYYKIENIVSLIISLIIFFTAYNIIETSIIDIINFFRGIQRIVIFIPNILLILIIFLAISFSLTLYLKIIGKRINSPIIQAEGSEKLYDNFISLSVIIGFLGIAFQFYLLDAIISLFIAIFIIKGGYDIFVTSTRTLLDAVIDFDKRTELWKLIEETSNIKKIKNLEIRAYGRYKFLELDIELNKEIPLSQMDNLKNKLDLDIKAKFPQIFKIIIIIHGSEDITINVAVPLEDNEGKQSKISTHYGESPFFALLEFKEGNLERFEILPNKFALEEKRKGILVSDWLISKKINKIYLKNVLKKGPYLIFNNNYVETMTSDLDTLNDVILIEKENSKRK